jgi:hypothetical protein
LSSKPSRRAVSGIVSDAVISSHAQCIITASYEGYEVQMETMSINFVANPRNNTITSPQYQVKLTGLIKMKVILVQVLETTSCRNAGKYYVRFKVVGPFPKPCTSGSYVHWAARSK